MISYLWGLLGDATCSFPPRGDKLFSEWRLRFRDLRMWRRQERGRPAITPGTMDPGRVRCRYCLREQSVPEEDPEAFVEAIGWRRDPAVGWVCPFERMEGVSP